MSRYAELFVSNKGRTVAFQRDVFDSLIRHMAQKIISGNY